MSICELCSREVDEGEIYYCKDCETDGVCSYCYADKICCEKASLDLKNISD